MMSRITLAILAALLIGGCTAGPPAQAPATAIPASEVATLPPTDTPPPPALEENTPTATTLPSVTETPVPTSPPPTDQPPPPALASPTPTAASSPTATSGAVLPPVEALTIQEYPVPNGSRPHDVAPAPDGSVWYTAQGAGALGRLDPATG